MTVERGDDDSDDDHFLDARSPKLTSKEAKKELLLLDSLASGRSAGDLAKVLQRLVVVQMGATIALCCLSLLALLDRAAHFLLMGGPAATVPRASALFGV